MPHRPLERVGGSNLVAELLDQAHSPTAISVVMVVVVVRPMVVVVRTLTGPVGGPSTPGLAMVAATTRTTPQFDEVVGHRQPHLLDERRVVGPEVGERGPEARSFHNHNLRLRRHRASPA